MNSNNIIDCDADPFLPISWPDIKRHIKGGMLTWDPGKFELMSKIKESEEITGDQLIEQLNKEESFQFNANVLEYLVRNQHEIPKEWRGRCILFPGTIFEFSRPFWKENRREWFCVRLLVWHEWGWIPGFRWLGSKFTDYHNVLVYKK